jgi:colicin import membrane protein
MRPFHAPGGAGELLARVSFLEPLLAGRRVLELGGAAATAGLSARALAHRGAARVVAADADEDGLTHAAASQPHASIEWRIVAGGALPEGPFDLVLVHDGGPLAADPARVAALAALLAPGGRLVAALPVARAPVLGALAGLSPPREAPAYESFLGSLEAVFPVVEVATQAATVGWVIAAASDPDPELAVDGAHGEPPEAAAYLAVCGDAASGLAGMVLVTLPAAQALRDTAARAAVDPAELRADAAAAGAEAVAQAARADEAERRIAEALAEAARAREALVAAEDRTRAAGDQANALRAKVAELEATVAAVRAEEQERARERDEARRESVARAREARAWADAQGRVEQKMAELEALAASSVHDAEIAHGEAARAIADAEQARARAEEVRYEADAALRRAELAEAELQRLIGDLAAGREEAERLRAELAVARARAAERAEG